MKCLLFILSIAFLTFESTPFSASESLSIDTEDSMFSESVRGVLTQQLQEDLHFLLVPIDKTNSASWASFAENVQKFFTLREVEYGKDIPIALRQASGGASEVSRVFERKVTDSDENNVWMGVFSYAPLSFDETLCLKKSDWTNIEMAVTVSTRANAPFAVHMGIFRNTLAYYTRFSREGGDYYQRAGAPEMHKGISVLLHKTIAQAVSLYRKKHGQTALRYMITSPLEMMRKIILNAMPEGTVAVGSNSEEADESYKDYKRSQIDSIRTEGIYAETTPIYEMYDEETKTKFELRNDEEETIWASEKKDDSWWLVCNASNIDPYITVPYSILADGIEIKTKK